MIKIFENCGRTSRQFKSLPSNKVYSLMQSIDASIIIDVRTQQEFDSSTGHLTGARSVPLHELNDRLSELEQYKNTQLIVYCHAGHRSKKASDILCANGFSVIDIDGGIDEWVEMKLPVIYSKLR